MNKIIFSITALLINSSTYAQHASEQTVSNFNHPESIVACKKHMYVSNVGSKMDPSLKDGDGYISKVNRKTGAVEELKYIQGLNSPKGMYIKRHRLYIADVDKIVAYNLKTHKKIFEKDMTSYDVAYLNDITRARGGIYVTATDKNKIFRITRNGKAKEVKLKNANLVNVNGIYRRPWGRTYVANFGTGNNGNGNVGRFSNLRKKYKTVKNAGINDGLVSRRGKLYITDWVNKEGANGRIVVYNKWNKSLKTADLPFAFGGPSDLFVDRKYKKLWVPSMTENKIVPIDLKELKMKPIEETKQPMVSLK